MNTQKANNQTISADNLIEDLSAQNAEEIKGGQTREHILLARQTLATSGGGSSTSGDPDMDGDVDGRDFLTWRR